MDSDTVDIVFLIVILCLILAFFGEPDLHDAVIYSLMESE